MKNIMSYIDIANPIAAYFPRSVKIITPNKSQYMHRLRASKIRKIRAKIIFTWKTKIKCPSPFGEFET